MKNPVADPAKIRFVGLDNPDVAAWHIAVAKGHHNTPPKFSSLDERMTFHRLNSVEMGVLVDRLKEIYDPKVVDYLMRCGVTTPASFYRKKLRNAPLPKIEETEAVATA